MGEKTTGAQQRKQGERISSRFSVVQNVVHCSRLPGADVVEGHRIGRAAGEAGSPHPWIGGVHVLVPSFTNLSTKNPN